MTKEKVIEKAKMLISVYPNEKNAENLIEKAWANRFFESESEAMAVWGRVRRELRKNGDN